MPTKAGSLERTDKATTTIPFSSALQDKGGLSVLKPQTQPSDFIFDTLKQIAQKKQAIIQAKIDADNKAKADALAAQQEQEVQIPTVNSLYNDTVIPPVYTPPPTMPTGSHTDLMAAAGINPGDYANVEWTVEIESQWDATEVNSSSGACHLEQSNPCGKDGCLITDLVCQLAWMNNYVLSTYGSWANEVAFHQANGWY